MTDIRWQHVRELFEAALELPEAERAAFLARADVATEVRAEVERMLSSDGAAVGFLESTSAILDGALLPRIGTRIGHYALKRVIASGGMGTVFEAVQDQPRRTVALKTLRFGLTSPERLQRFRFEAEVLGQLRHPSIAQVFEAGTHEEAGEHLPFIAMELVPGARDILSYAREKALELRERLALFLEVCEAVQHGHQKGVIHRDLKPSNILVDAEGRAKVIDFGVARATASASPFGAVATQTGQLVGTMAYMAPEQLAGSAGAVDVRSDVYALGILLFELIEGRPPHELASKSPLAALRTIQEEAPRLSPDTPRELGWIAAKALAKEPERRYGSVSELSEDLRRYLRREPVLAGAPSIAYRLSKWIRRNPAKSVAAAIGAVAFVAITWLLIQNVRTNSDLRAERASLASANVALRTKTAEAEERRIAVEREKERADGEAREATRRADEVLRLSALQTLDDLTAEADQLWPAIPDNLPRYEDWLKRADALVSELPDHERKLAELRAKARPWTEEEQVRHRAGHPKLAELESARRHMEHRRKLSASLETDAAASATSPDGDGLDSTSLPETADALNEIAWPMIDPGRKDWGREQEGLVLARRAMELAGGLSPAERASIRDTLAWALFANGRFDEAVAEEERALEEAAAEGKVEFEGYLERLRKEIAEETDPEKEAKRAKVMAELEQHIDELEAEVFARPEWVFADAQDKWWHSQLEKLVAGLTSLADARTGLFSEGTSPEHGWGIRKRSEFVRTIVERSVLGAEATARWAEAIASVSNAVECPRYGGLRINPQLGLLPIGRDPDSDLWEFAHLQTGEPAQRGADGKLNLEEDTGLVFVLLPGGAFTMGAQRQDPAGPNYDPQALPEEDPPHEVTLSPFFLSKYEMTQGQWLRFVGQNPSVYGPHDYSTDWNRAGRMADLVHPVERVSWDHCTAVLQRLGLELPSEAQWEYGARAGTTTVWWTGNDKQTLANAANVLDAYAAAHGAASLGNHDRDLDDGNSIHARVGSYRPNAFGLHDVSGNLWEWCRDGYQQDCYRQGAQKDPVSNAAGSPYRIYRGGCLSTNASRARSALRDYAKPSIFGPDIGCRPAMRISP